MVIGKLWLVNRAQVKIGAKVSELIEVSHVRDPQFIDGYRIVETN